jgi:hypothetical protein
METNGKIGRNFYFLVCFGLLAGCNYISSPLSKPPIVSPSPLPPIISPTPSWSPTSTASVTLTFSPTTTPELLTPSPTPAGLIIDLLGCNTSLDITHGMGEVTNAYPILKNLSNQDLSDVCATLSASDEGRPHPQKTGCIPYLPKGYQGILKLTVDTGFRKDTSIQVEVVSNQGVNGKFSRESCRTLGLPGWVPGKVGLLEPVP